MFEFLQWLMGIIDIFVITGRSFYYLTSSFLNSRLIDLFHSSGISSTPSNLLKGIFRLGMLYPHDLQVSPVSTYGSSISTYICILTFPYMSVCNNGIFLVKQYSCKFNVTLRRLDSSLFLNYSIIRNHFLTLLAVTCGMPLQSFTSATIWAYCFF